MFYYRLNSSGEGAPCGWTDTASLSERASLMLPHPMNLTSCRWVDQICSLLLFQAAMLENLHGMRR